MKLRDISGTIERALAAAGLAARAPHAAQGAQATAAGDKPAQPPRGATASGVFGNQYGTRAYNTYVPATLQAPALPMIVMLHGCTQSADDFAIGTRMNSLADEHGFIVLYPEQPARANGAKCWNWFNGDDQQRDRGEPSLIAGMTREVAQRHGVDPHRIFIAGLSAGAAMAIIMGETYPDLYAGIGAHSGLPYGAAHDVSSALAAMKSARVADARADGAANTRARTHATPIIVFHGDSDRTVDPANSAEIVRQAAHAHAPHAPGFSPRVEHRTGTAGRGYTRTIHAEARGQPRVEAWTLHGAGHAWSGGHSEGSHTDASGPDASAEMVRFFLAQPSPGSS